MEGQWEEALLVLLLLVGPELQVAAQPVQPEL
jgi:hypothetical protein